jgi:DNA mismatch repair protein MutH
MQGTQGPPRRSPPAAPRTRDELFARARSLEGLSLGTLALEEGAPEQLSRPEVRQKGRPGALVERALGATGAGKVHDFPALRVELKTVPVDLAGAPLESTYVCTFSLADAERQEWASSWVREKLSCVLFVPVVGERDTPYRERVLGRAVLWAPSLEEERELEADFDELVGLVGVGRVEELTAHRGRSLQVRPKARDGRARTLAHGADGERLATVPRGFYLRPSFTRALLSRG